MKLRREHWRKYKLEFWKRLWEDLEIGYLDEDLLPILIKLNIDAGFYTMSSCSGRVVFSDSKYPWSREETSIVYKKHYPISVEEAAHILDKPVVRRLWVNVSGPIIHVSTDRLSRAKLLLKLARKAGLKHSGILSINPSKGIIVELMSGIKMTQLLKTPYKQIVPEDRLADLVNLMNEVLIAGKHILLKLEEAIKDFLPLEEDEEVLRDLAGRGIDYSKLSVKSILARYI